MREFAEAFLLVFGQLAVGGWFSLSVPPFGQVGRGFFRSTASVYLGAALCATAGWGWLAIRWEPRPSSARWGELSLWLVFCLAAGNYVRSLASDSPRQRARSYLASLAAGVLAVSVTATRYASADPLEAVLYTIAFGVSAAVLGAASTGMLLGHWYLIETGLTLTPLWRVLRFFVATLRAQLAMLALAVAASLTSPRGATAAAWDDHLVLFSSRVLFGPVAAYALAEMIRRTLAIPQTMAATGLFYIALLAVLVGEILGRSLLFRTGWPV